MKTIYLNMDERYPWYTFTESEILHSKQLLVITDEKFAELVAKRNSMEQYQQELKKLYKGVS